MADNLLWGIILGYIFLRPFVSEIDFTVLAYILNLIFLSAGWCYLFLKKKNIRSLLPIDKLILLFLFVLIASSDNYLNSFIQLNKYLPLITLFFIARSSSQKEKNKLISILMISLVIVSIYSLCSVYIISKFVTGYLSKNINYPYAGELLVRKRAYYPFITPNLLSNYLVMAFMLCLGVTLQQIKDNKKYLFVPISLNFLCLLLGLITLFLTKSVGGWLTFLVAISMFFILGKKLNKKSLLVILLIVFGLFLIWIMRIQVNEEFTKPTFSIQKRILYWKETIDIIKMHPFKGIGIGNLYLGESRTTHNTYLQLWAETGIIGFISWLGIVLVFIRDNLKMTYKKDMVYYKLGLFTCGLSFIVHNIIDFSFFIPEVAFLWWIILGLSYNEI